MNDFVSNAVEKIGDILVTLMVLGVFAAGVWVFFVLARQPGYQQLIDDWCAARQLRLVNMDRRLFLKGPFFLNPNGTAVFYITVRDPLGYRRHFWVRCGHWIFGMLTPEIHVV